MTWRTNPQQVLQVLGPYPGVRDVMRFLMGPLAASLAYTFGAGPYP